MYFQVLSKENREPIEYHNAWLVIVKTTPTDGTKKWTIGKWKHRNNGRGYLMFSPGFDKDKSDDSIKYYL